MEGNHTFLTQTELTAHFTRVMQGEMPVPKTQEEMNVTCNAPVLVFVKKYSSSFSFFHVFTLESASRLTLFIG